MYTLCDLERDRELGYIHTRTHPKSPDVTLYNYTQKAQYDSAWRPAVMASRGLILRGEKHVARPFSKFFNVSEHVGHGDSIPEHTHWELYDKVDGSLGVVFWLDDHWEVATRGSFTSPQSAVATEMLQALQVETLNPAYTYLFEIVYPENRIVVDYHDRKELVLLGGICTETGKELEYEELEFTAGLLGTSVVRRIARGTTPFSTWTELQDTITKTYDGTTKSGSDAEGFVVRLVGTQITRAKWKYPLYSQLHKTLSYLTNITVWEHLQAGTLPSLLELMPDEIFGAIKKVEKDLVAEYEKHTTCVTALYATIPTGTPKERALAINLHDKYKTIMFAMQQGKTDRVNKLLWDMCRPEKLISLTSISDD